MIDSNETIMYENGYDSGFTTGFDTGWEEAIDAFLTQFGERPCIYHNELIQFAEELKR